MRKLKSQVDLFFLDLLYRFSPYTRFFLERNFYQSTKDYKLSQIELLKKKNLQDKLGNMAQICENCEIVTKPINRLRNCVRLCNKESNHQINALK